MRKILIYIDKLHYYIAIIILHYYIDFIIIINVLGT